MILKNVEQTTSPEFKRFKIFKKEKDASFNIDSLEKYELLVQFGSNDLQIAVIDAESSKILIIEDYILPGITGLNERLDCFKQIFNDHHLLLANFWKEIKIGIKCRKYSIVPQSLFDDKNPQVYLDVNAPFDSKSETIQVTSIDKLGIKIIFSVETHLLDQIRASYPVAGFKTTPQCGSLILGLKDFPGGNNENILYLFIDRFVLHLVVFKNNQLNYYNQFAVTKFEDYIRFISMVIADQELDISRDNFILWGFLGSGASQYGELKKHYPRIKLGQRPPGLVFGHAFDEFPEYQYFDLLSMNLL
jgi:hypothetical protein